MWKNSHYKTRELRHVGENLKTRRPRFLAQPFISGFVIGTGFPLLQEKLEKLRGFPVLEKLEVL